MNNHDIHDFFNSSQQVIAREYARIRKRANEDPGTAGDQGEENWATLLRGWLPPYFHVVTKGRILTTAIPQELKRKDWKFSADLPHGR